jgi:hypothetical protein
VRAIDKYKEFLKEEELKAELEAFKKQKTEENKRLVLELCVHAIGYTILIYQTNLWVGLGVFFVVWGNNLGLFRGLNKKIK